MMAFNQKVVEIGYDMNGKKIEWRECVECGGLVWTTETDPTQVYCGSNKQCMTNKKSMGGKEIKKEKINDGLRWEVWERDNFTCKKCGSRKKLTIDHIIPESKGGKATLENCQTLCNKCNSSKGAR